MKQSQSPQPLLPPDGCFGGGHRLECPFWRLTQTTEPRPTCRTAVKIVLTDKCQRRRTGFKRVLSSRYGLEYRPMGSVDLAPGAGGSRDSVFGELQAASPQSYCCSFRDRSRAVRALLESWPGLSQLCVPCVSINGSHISLSRISCNNWSNFKRFPPPPTLLLLRPDFSNECVLLDTLSTSRHERWTPSGRSFPAGMVKPVSGTQK
jgi:hypothetical protein